MRKGDKSRRELIECAAAMFDERGYDLVGMRDIAESLGWPKSLVYYYCPGKSQLAQAAARERAEAELSAVRAELDACAAAPCAQLERALGYAGFWRCGAQAAARELRTRYTTGNLAWRVCLRAQLAPGLGELCGGIIARGVRSYAMYTPYPEQTGRVVVDLASDLSDALAQLVCARPGELEVLERSSALLDAYRSALERIVEAPFGALRLIELEYVRDVARAYELELERWL